MAAFVIDASAALPWAFADEATPATNQLLTRLRTGDEAIVAAHWPLEVANALLIAVRRKRLSLEDAQQFLDDLEVLPIQVDTGERVSLRKQVFWLAIQSNLTAYDAAYLELAVRESLPLATLDRELCEAARRARIALIEL